MEHRIRAAALLLFALMTLPSICAAEGNKQQPKTQSTTIGSEGPAYSPEYGVRFIYLVPKNRTPQEYAVRNMKEWSKIVRYFYGREMAKYGIYKPGTTEGKTFACDEDENGDPYIHVIYGTEDDNYYANNVFGGPPGEAAKHFDSNKSVFCIFPECYKMHDAGVITGGAMGGTNCGNFTGPNLNGFAVIGGDTLWLLEKAKWWDNTPYDGMKLPWFDNLPLVFGVSYPGFQGATVGENSGVFFGAAAHELGHGFGISHCFCSGDTVPGVGDLMGNGCRGFRGIYGDFPGQGSVMCKWDCEFVAQSPYFNPGRPRTDMVPPEETEDVTIEQAGTSNVNVHAKLSARDEGSGLYRNVISFLPAGSQATSTEFDAEGKADVRMYSSNIPVDHLNPKSYIFFFRPIDNQGNLRENQVWAPVPVSIQQQYCTPGGIWTAVAEGGQAANGNLRFILSLFGTQEYSKLTPEVEVQPVGTPFTGTPNFTGSTVDFGSTDPAVANVSVALGPGKYHWRYRIRNSAPDFPFSCWITPGNDDLTTTDIETAATPTFITQPVSQMRCIGQSATLSVKIIGGEPLYCQWRKSGVDIPGATSPTYTIPSLTLAEAGAYSCKIWNSTASVISKTVNLRVMQGTPAQIDKQPTNQSACWWWGTNVAMGKPTTASNCFINDSTSSVVDGSSYPYTRWTTYGCGSNATEWFEVDFLDTYSIGIINTQIYDDNSGVRLPKSVDYYYKNASGQLVLLAVNGTPQGSDNGTQPNTLLFPPVNATGVRVVLHKDPAQLSMGVGLSELEVYSGCKGKSASFEVHATGTDPITYQWRKNGIAISGATASSYTIPTAIPSDAGTYDCVVKNLCMETPSDPAILNVCTELQPSVYLQYDKAISPGTNIELDAWINGCGDYTYQWQKNGVTIEGATTYQYKIPSCTIADSGDYTCSVTDACGTAVSAPTKLFVAEEKTIAEAKDLQDGTSVVLKSYPVTVAFDDNFYVEDNLRIAGLRIDNNVRRMYRGYIVNIGGVIRGGPNQELHLDASIVTPIDYSYNLIKPLGMSGLSLGGSSRGLQDPVWSWRWMLDENKKPISRWLPSIGANNIGLFVRVFGHVTQIDPEGNYFYIDDGSGIKDGTMTLQEENKGLCVAFDGRAYQPGQFVMINGISSCKVVDSNLIRLLKVERTDDITVLNGNL